MLLALNQAQIPADTYGKTEAQILSMGSKAWYKFYTSKAGESTYGMSNAYGIYGDVAAKRNDRILADPKTPNRQNIKQLADLLTQFGSDMVDLAYNITGGGTMWGPIGNSAYADAQDTIYALIHPQNQPKPKHHVVSEITKQLAAIPSILKGPSDYITKENKKQVLKDIPEINALYAKIVKIAAKENRTTSDRILEYCLNQTKLLDIAKP